MVVGEAAAASESVTQGMVGLWCVEKYVPRPAVEVFWMYCWSSRVPKPSRMCGNDVGVPGDVVKSKKCEYEMEVLSAGWKPDEYPA